MKFLVVDDSAVTRRIIVNALSKLGHTEILEAADGQAALAMADTTIDVVITDWNLPGMSGVELVRTLRANPDLAHLPILLVTARNVKQDVVEAAQAGVNAYIVKPFTIEILQHKLAQVLPEGPAVDAVTIEGHPHHAVPHSAPHGSSPAAGPAEERSREPGAPAPPASAPNAGAASVARAAPAPVAESTPEPATGTDG